MTELYNPNCPWLILSLKGVGERWRIREALTHEEVWRLCLRHWTHYDVIERNTHSAIAFTYV